MNILFLTLADFKTIEEHAIYPDLLRTFRDNYHKIFVISPIERRVGKETYVIEEGNTIILKLKIGNTQKTNVLEKGISTVMIEPQMIRGIKKYFGDVRFDLILYSTPPITLYSAIRYVKRRDNAKTYLLLKDIFPQNSLDLGMLSKRGFRGLLYRYFRKKEQKLYGLSDKIGCMSQANVDYVLKNNQYVYADKVEICANSTELIDKSIDYEHKLQIRNKYNLPIDKILFLYGGNLGKPQGIDFMIECFESQKNNESIFFLIIGSGTEYEKIQNYCSDTKQKNLLLMKGLPKDEYDAIAGACDVGMIFLDHRFTIPNFPSRLLSYMQVKLPVWAITDPNTDIGKVIMDGNFGWWTESNNFEDFKETIDSILGANREQLGLNSWIYMQDHFDVKQSYETIINSCGSL